MTPNQAGTKIIDKIVFDNLPDRKVRRKPKFKLRDLVRTPDNKNVFGKGDSTSWSYKLNTITEVIHDTVPTYKNNYLAERYNQNLLRPIKLVLGGNNHFMQKLNLVE